MYKNVLIIDDDPISILVCETMLRKQRFAEEITSFKSGEKGMEYVLNHFEQGGAVPDFIFLDVQMPVIDGWEFLETYQQIPQVSSAAPHVVMLSASYNSDDVLRAQSYRVVQEFLGKPVTAETLESLKAGR